jgi:type II secretory pathway pseudopilin PulG
LLIVVAIIAILAAIAVPNFLEAQVRSKVSRVHADHRSIANALESYRVDNHAYPATWVTGIPDGWPLPWGYRLVPLTTPIAYITSVPLDGFQIPENIHYNYDDTASLRKVYSGSSGLPSYWFVNGGELNTYEWQIVSKGPDRTLGWGEPYDPSNGTISYGDIIRFGP